MASQGPVWLPVVIIGVTVAGLAGAGYAAWVADKKRNAAFQTVASTMGFSYEEKVDAESLAPLVGDLPLFGRGHSRKAKRLLKGRLADRDAAIFDYRYTTGGGKNSQTHRQTVVVFPSGAAKLPDFEMSPENPLHAVAEFFGAQDINFEQSPEFSKRYLLKGSDETAVRRLFTIDALGFFGAVPGWSVASRSGRLSVCRAGKSVAPAEVPAFAAEALRIAGLFKA